MSSSSKNSRMTMLVAGFAVVIAVVAYFGDKFPVPEDQTAVLIDVVCKSSGHQEKKTLYNAVAAA